MASTKAEIQALRRSGGQDDAVAALGATTNLTAIPAALGATTDLTAVPGTFADEAAVQTYLATLVPEVEARLDAIEAKLEAVRAAASTDVGVLETRLDAAEAKVDTLISEAKESGQMASS